jgi:hypothetical protein
MSVPLRVGIAGYGVVGKRRRQFIDRHPSLKTVAVCDRTYPADGVFDDSVLNDRQVTGGSSADALKSMHLVYRIYCADPAWRAQYGLSDHIPPEFICPT